MRLPETVLRAAAYAAFETRGTDDYEAAIGRVVDVIELEPLIAVDRAIADAKMRVRASAVRRQQVLELLRDTNVWVREEVPARAG